MLEKLTVESTFKNYDITFISKVSQLPTPDANTITIIDSNVLELFPVFSCFNPIQIKCDENTKTLCGSSILFNELLARKANRFTKLLVIGGGILQDVAGFCSSVFCRGIEYVLVPTTLLSQSDSCIGGKTSINFEHKKNILGTFYPPSQIIICEEFLTTLSELDIISGLGEIYKFHILQNKIKEFSTNPNFLNVVHSSLEYKKSILQLDEFDKKERQYLNFGHTFGHALETTSNHNLPHGIAVIIGCMIAVRVSIMMNCNIQNEHLIYEHGINLLRKSNISFNRDWFNVEQLLEAAKSDKKSNGNLRMVLMSDKPFLENIINLEIVSKAINETYESI